MQTVLKLAVVKADLEWIIIHWQSTRLVLLSVPQVSTDLIGIPENGDQIEFLNLGEIEQVRGLNHNSSDFSVTVILPRDSSFNIRRKYTFLTTLMDGIKLHL